MTKKQAKNNGYCQECPWQQRNKCAAPHVYYGLRKNKCAFVIMRQLEEIRYKQRYWNKSTLDKKGGTEMSKEFDAEAFLDMQKTWKQRQQEFLQKQMLEALELAYKQMTEGGFEKQDVIEIVKEARDKARTG